MEKVTYLYYFSLFKWRGLFEELMKPKCFQTCETRDQITESRFVFDYKGTKNHVNVFI